MAEETVTPVAPTISPEEAKKILEDQLRKTVNDCSKDVEAVLRKYNCRLQVEQVIKVLPNVQ